MERRDFLKGMAGAGAGLALGGRGAEAGTVPGSAPAIRSGQAADVAVVGAAAFGAWTALHLQRMGARVTLVDQHGAAHSRATSGGETRGVRTSYGDRPHGLQWGRWATTAIERWQAWDEEYADSLLPPLYYTTGDVILRDEMTPFQLRLGRVRPPGSEEGRMDGLTLQDGNRVQAGTYVFALGPWLPKFFPERLGRGIRIRTLGHVYYVSTPPADDRFQHPTLPSFKVPGVTGWSALPRDFRGFRIRTGGHRGDDPDTSVRWIDAEYHDRPREVLATYFPELADRPFNETRACHYCGTVHGNFIIDRHGGLENVWIAGGGSAEAFKQGPVLGEFVASRVLGEIADEDELARSLRVPDEEYGEDEGGDVQS